MGLAFLSEKEQYVLRNPSINREFKGIFSSFRPSSLDYIAYTFSGHARRLPVANPCFHVARKHGRKNSGNGTD